MSDRRSATGTLEATAVRTFVLDQRIRYSYSSPVTDIRQYLRIVPPATHGRQRRIRWSLEVEGVDASTVRTFSDAFGNLTVAISVPRVDDAVDFVLHVEASTDTCASGSRHATFGDRRCLTPTALTRPDDAISDLVGASGGSSSDGRGRVDIAALCDRVHHALAYEWGITGVHTTASEALAGGRGVCQDYAHVMLSACRLAGVTARYVSGHLTGEGGSHAWVEVLRPHDEIPGSWVAEGWDPTHNRRTNHDYLVVAVGRDYADAAPMWGTYEGDDVTSTLVVNKRLSV